jgi:hypothetical protein
VGTRFRFELISTERLEMRTSNEFSFVGGEVIADFPEPYTVEEVCLSAADGEPEMLDFWAFQKAPL